MAWGPGSPDYYGCQQLTGAAFENVFCQTLWAAYAKMLSYYIFFYGCVHDGLCITSESHTTPSSGTSWGALPYPGVYSK